MAPSLEELTGRAAKAEAEIEELAHKASRLHIGLPLAFASPQRSGQEPALQGDWSPLASQKQPGRSSFFNTFSASPLRCAFGRYFLDFGAKIVVV